MKLTSIKLDELSLVDKPASKKKVLFFKSQGEHNMDNYNPITGDYDTVKEGDVEKSSGNNWPSLTAHVETEESEDDSDEFEKFIPFLIEKDSEQHVFSAVIYEPDVVDAQGDSASAEEIEKAAFNYMENTKQVFKVMHKGKSAKIKVLESYIAPQDLTIAKQKVTKGSWVMTVRVNDSKIWKAIKEGKLTGFSMAGYAKAG